MRYIVFSSPRNITILLKEFLGGGERRQQHGMFGRKKEAKHVFIIDHLTVILKFLFFNYISKNKILKQI